MTEGYTIIHEISSSIHKDFEGKDSAREYALKISRQIIRNCRTAMINIHRGKFKEATLLIDESKDLLGEIDAKLCDYPDIYYAGFVENAQQEYVECCVVQSLLKQDNEKHMIPAPEKLGVGNTAYLNGLADVPGELRRHILDLIRQDRPDEGEVFLEIMEDIYSALMIFEYPDAMTRGLRHRTDKVRSLIERTRGDLTNAIRQQKLEYSMREFGSRL